MNTLTQSMIHYNQNSRTKGPSEEGYRAFRAAVLKKAETFADWQTAWENESYQLTHYMNDVSEKKTAIISHTKPLKVGDVVQLENREELKVKSVTPAGIICTDFTEEVIHVDLSTLALYKKQFEQEFEAIRQEAKNQPKKKKFFFF